MAHHSAGFIMAPRGDAGLRLIQGGRQGSGANAFVLLYMIATRARYTEKGDGLKMGQCYISTHELPLTRQQTRTAISNLESTGQITTKPTAKGTVVTLINTDIFDINADESTGQITTKPTTKQPRDNQPVNHKLTSNKQGNKDSNKETKNKGSVFEVVAFAKSRGLPESDGNFFFESMQAGGWTRAGKAIKDWKAAFRAWQAGGYLPSQKKQPKTQQPQRGYSY